MQPQLEVLGMVIKSIPVGEYDRAVTILTRERGKISAFARNARKINNKLMANTGAFCFGTFKLFQGKSSYSIADVQIQQYFEGFRTDLDAAYYGMYFLEVADYYTRENNDEAQMLKLLYQTMKAVLHPGLSNELVRITFEAKAMVVNGEFPGIPQNSPVSDSAAYTLQFIMDTPIEKLYTFNLNEETLKEVQNIIDSYKDMVWNHTFKSFEMLQGLINK